MTTEKSGLWGWGALLILIAYAFFVHQGMGVARDGGMGVWWDPRYPTTEFLTWPIWGQLETLLGYEDAEYSDTWRIHAFLILIPAVLLAGCVIAGTRSALARGLAFTSVIAILLFVFCGFVADGMWKLFHWRTSALIVSISAALGFTLASPWLAASWLRLNWGLRCLVYLPLLVGLVILFRHTTGWDPSLMMNLSPWPALPTFGVGIGGYAILGFLLAISLAVAGVALLTPDAAQADSDAHRLDPDLEKLLGFFAIVAGLAAPAVWISWGFPLDDRARVGLTLAGIVVIGLALFTRSSNRKQALLRRSGHTALGVLLVFVPICIGQASTKADYNESREIIAQEVISALHQYYLAEQTYPNELEDLVDNGFLEGIPNPRVGFQFVYDMGYAEPYEFDYRGFGTSYVLEFVSTEWIQCAYNPPYLDEYGNEYEEYEDEEDDEGGGDIWTCTMSRPQFF